MSIYKVRIHADVHDGFFGLFNKQIDGVELIEADSAQEAKEAIERQLKIRVDPDDARVWVSDVELMP